MTTRFYYRDPDAPAAEGPRSIGALALIERDGALLMERRSDCGRWGLIGGGLEADESLVDALRREVFEETGLTVTDASLFGTFSDPSRIIHYAGAPPRRLLTLVYRATVESFDGLRASEESLELRFVPRAELAALDIVETARPIIDAYLTRPAVVLA